MHEINVLICALGMVRGDRNLFVRKGGASYKRLGNTGLNRWNPDKNGAQRCLTSKNGAQRLQKSTI